MFSPVLWLMRRFAPKEEDPVWILLERFIGSSRYIRYDWVILPVLLMGGFVGAFKYHPLLSMLAALTGVLYLTTTSHIFTTRLVRAGWVADVVLAPIPNRKFWNTFARLFLVLVPVMVVPLLYFQFVAMLYNGIDVMHAVAVSVVSALYLLAIGWGNYWSSFISYSRASIVSGALVTGLCLAVFQSTDKIVYALLDMSTPDSLTPLLPLLGIMVAGSLPMIQTRNGYTEYLVSRASKDRKSTAGES